MGHVVPMLVVLLSILLLLLLLLLKLLLLLLLSLLLSLVVLLLILLIELGLVAELSLLHLGNLSCLAVLLTLSEGGLGGDRELLGGLVGVGGVGGRLVGTGASWLVLLLQCSHSFAGRNSISFS